MKGVVAWVPSKTNGTRRIEVVVDDARPERRFPLSGLSFFHANNNTPMAGRQGFFGRRLGMVLSKAVSVKPLIGN